MNKLTTRSKKLYIKHRLFRKCIIQLDQVRIFVLLYNDNNTPEMPLKLKNIVNYVKKRIAPIIDNVLSLIFFSKKLLT